MLDHKPYPIADYSQGRFTARDPWLAPQDSWKELYDAAVIDGKVRSRRGYRLLSDLYTKYATLSVTVQLENISGPIGIARCTAENTSTGKNLTAIRPYASGPFQFTCTDGTETWTDNGDGFLTGDQGGGGAIHYNVADAKQEESDNVACRIELIAGTGSIGSQITITQMEGNLGDPPVMACGEFIPESNPDEIKFWAISTTRFYVWNEALSIFEDYTDQQPGGTAGDIFTGTEADRFWVEPFGDRLILTNGKDELWWYAPLDSGGAGAETLRKMVTTFDEDVENAGADPERIWAAKVAIRHKNRILYLHTLEGTVSGGSSGATWYPGRARRSNVNDAEAFQGSDIEGGSLAFSDAPTNRRIISAGVLGNDVVVFFDYNQTWSHEYTGDPRRPYEWREVSLMRGGAARKSTVTVYQDLVSLSSYSLMATDGRELRDVDDPMPRYVIERVDPEYIARGEGFVEHTDEQSWVTVYPKGSEDPQTLTRSYKNGSYALYRWPLTCFGYFRDQAGKLTVDQYTTPPWPATVDEYSPSRPVDSYDQGSIEERLVIGGTRDGQVMLVFREADDDGSEVTIQGITQRMNPFDNASDVHLGWIDILTTAHQDKTLTVRLFSNFSVAAYDTVEVDLSPAGDDSKVRRIIPVNQIAAYHQIEIQAVGVPGLEVHALTPWMAEISETVAPV